MKCKPAVGAATGTGLVGKDGLVAFAVGGLVGSLDIGRQRHVADPFEPRREIRSAEGELNHAKSVFAALEDHGLDVLGEANTLSDAHLAARPRKCLPTGRVGLELLQQQDFDKPADVALRCRRMDSRSTPEQSRRESRANC